MNIKKRRLRELLYDDFSQEMKKYDKTEIKAQ